jgi:hypothetical protein
MNEQQHFTERKERVGAVAGWAATDAFQRSAQHAERERCAEMLARYIARGHTDAEVVAYATALLRTDY